MSRRSAVFAALLLACLSASLSFAQANIPPGPVSGFWVADSTPYYIEGEIYIPAGDSLTIEPGVDVFFLGHYKLIVYGKLEAVGHWVRNR